MLHGTPDLILLAFVFLGLQVWWIIPLIKKNNIMDGRNKLLREEIQRLEKLYRK